jgi:hypothetical protein
MATPHTAGVTALLLSARPAYRHNPLAMRTVLSNSAFHINSSLCSSNGTYPNNLFGYGRINALAAYNYVGLVSGVSRKTHGAAGNFDIPLVLGGNPSVECRSSGGNHTFVFTFNNSLLSGNATVTAGTGTVSGSPVISGNTMTVNLTGVADVQRLSLTLQSVTDTNSQVMPDTAVTVKFLAGDTGNNSVVNASDIAQTKAQIGASVTGTNFREDVNVNGTITSTDVALVKSVVGHSVP